MSEKYFDLVRSENKFFSSQKISITDLKEGTSLILIATNHIVGEQATSFNYEYTILNKEEMIRMAKTIFDHFGLSYIPEISSEISL